MSEHATFSLDGEELEVVRVEGEEAVSELFRIEVDCRVPRGPVPGFSCIGAEASLSLQAAGGARTIRAIVASLQSTYFDDGSRALRCVLRPPAFLLSLGRNCRAFIEQDVVGIVSTVLAGVRHRWQVAGAFDVRPYTVQYREDDWSFVCRLLEQEGIYYWFDHAAGSELVFGDHSPAADALDGGALIAFHHDTGMVVSGEVIEQLGGVARVAPGAFSVKSFNPDKPDLEVSASSGSGALEIYDAAGGGPTSPEAAARMAARMRGATEASRAGISGSSNSVRIAPGRILEVAGHPAGYDGAYFVTRASYRIRQRHRGGEGAIDRAVSCSFSGIASSTPFVPPAKTPAARQAGLQTGVVGGPPGAEIHPDPSGRVRVQQHWDREGRRDDRSGTWMRVAQRGANDSLQLPRMGWNVLTFNDEGSVDAPSVLARVNDGEHPPAYPLPANKTRVVFKTPTSPEDGTSNEIYFEDRKGSEEMFINASKDMNVLVKHVKTQAVYHDSTRQVGQDHTLTVSDRRSETVHHDQIIEVGRDADLTVGDSISEAVSGNLRVQVAGNRSVEAEALSLSAAATHEITVGTARIDTCLGSISASSAFVSLTTGAAQLKLSAQSIDDASGGLSVQTIGGARLQFCGEDRPVDAEKVLLESVGGLMMLETAKGFSDAAEKTASWQVGAGLDFQAAQASILEGYTKVTFVCGDSSITVDEQSIAIKSPQLVLDRADGVEIVAGIIEHN